MAEEIDAQERLEAVQTLISDCETTAIEIEKQFSELDSIIGISETRTEELLAEVETTSTEVISRSEAFTGELISRVGGINSRVSDFVAAIESLLGSTEERSDVLFERLRYLDISHGEAIQIIDENAQHMREIFEGMTTQWITADKTISALQEQRHNEIIADVRQHIEIQTEQQAGWQRETKDQGINEHQEIISNISQHISSISEDFEQSLTSGVETLLEQGREMQTQAAEEFSQMRENAGDTIFGSTKDLHDAVEGVMSAMTTTVTTTSEIADTVVDAMDQTNVGLNQIVEAVENVMQLLGGLSLD